MSRLRDQEHGEHGRRLAVDVELCLTLRHAERLSNMLARAEAKSGT